MSYPIYSIGSRNARQAALRNDGVWFQRERVTTVWGSKWSKWYPIATRPDGAWYNPNASRARLPKD